MRSDDLTFSTIYSSIRTCEHKAFHKLIAFQLAIQGDPRYQHLALTRRFLASGV